MGVLMGCRTAVVQSFTIKHGYDGYFLYDEDNEITIKLKRPGDKAHAEAVRKFLKENIESIE